MAGAAVATVAGLTTSAHADDANVEKVTVTGSRIPQKGLTSISPVTTITSAEAKLQGTTTAETLLNSLPQVAANQGAELSNGSTGTATVDLRGLGPKRTLVLINGKRMQPANLLAPTPDLNTIPLPMLERVEVLTGGASAVYGADAVAGVVNFIMRKNIEGLEVGGQVGEFFHENDNTTMRQLITDSNFSNADKSVNDGRTVNVWGLIGANIADGKGNVTAYMQYRQNQFVLQSERDFSQCALADIPGQDRKCLGSSNGPTGKFTIKNTGLINDGFGKQQRFTASGTTTGDFRPFVGTDTYNFSPTNYLIRPDERYLLGYQAHYELAADIEIYSEASFMEDNTTAQIAASGFFGGGGPVGGNYLLNCDNPFLQTGAAEGVVGGVTQITPFNALCGNNLVSVSGAATLAAPLGTTGTATIDLGRRFFESGLGRQDIFKTDSYRLVGGLRGQVEDWDYDVFAQYGTTSTPRVYANDVSRSRASRGLLVVLDPRVGSPTFGQPVCQSVVDGTDTSCIPIDIFTIGHLTPQAIAYASGTGIRTSITKETVVSGSTNGEFGFGIPWATDHISAALGAEYRLSQLQAISDDVFSSGDLLGQGGSTPNVNGHYDVWEGFGELQVPIVQDKPFAKLLEVNAGYRISDYDFSGITHTYKYGGSWMPTDDLRVRGSFQRAVRSPNVIELFTPQAQGTFAGRDLCANSTSSSNPSNYSAAQCAHGGTSPGQSGMTLAQYTAANAAGGFQCTSSQCAGTFGGNQNLKPEVSDTKSFGIVFTPKFLKGFNANVDYYDIFIDAPLQVQNGNVIQVECYRFNLADACSRIHRDALGTILDTTDAGFGVNQLTQNIGSQKTTGIDYGATYRFDFDNINLVGALTFDLTGTWTDKLENKNGGAGYLTYDCAGLFGLICGLPVPKDKRTFRTTWSTPWDVDLSFNWRYLSSVRLDVDTSDPVLGGFCNGPCHATLDDSIKSFDYFDVAFRWEATDYLSITGGVNNVTDEDPPILDSNIFGISSPPLGNGNTYPVVYDSMGRQAFISATSKF